MVAGEHAQAARINRERLVQSEFGGEIRHRARPQRSGVCSAPGTIGAQIFLLAAIGVIDAAVQHQFSGAAFQFGERDLRQERDGIMVQLAETHRIQIAEQAGGIVIPAPP